MTSETDKQDTWQALSSQIAAVLKQHDAAVACLFVLAWEEGTEGETHVNASYLAPAFVSAESAAINAAYTREVLELMSQHAAACIEQIEADAMEKVGLA